MTTDRSAAYLIDEGAGGGAFRRASALAFDRVVAAPEDVVRGRRPAGGLFDFVVDILEGA